MSELERPFLRGFAAQPTLPLGRFLPPHNSGMVTAWLREQISGAQWLLDPLVSTPALALEAARAGYRVLAASNNPILTFMLEILASAPRPADFQSALAELGSSRRGTERLEIHLQQLYQTQCPGCGELTPAQAYLWRKGETQPYARLVRCQACATEGEYPVTPGDLERLARTGSDSLHRSRALERVALAGDEDRPAVEEALKSYLPRPLYVLFTLINKTEGLPTTPERKRLLMALMLSLCDEASSLWPWPSARTRPRQLTVPPTFRENNLWLALENAIPLWCGLEQPIPVTHYPEPAPPGGICIYPGRLKALLPLPEALTPAAAVAVLPRPNQAFWTLSALWAGWLWGREAVQAIKVSFDRRRYDWHWHGAALFSLFNALNANTAEDFPLVALAPELTAGFLSASITASRAAGLKIDGFALRGDLAQIQWRTSSGSPQKPVQGLERMCREGIEDHLRRRGEPDSYLPLYAAALLEAVLHGGLPANLPQYNAEIMDTLQAVITRLLDNRARMVHFPGQSTSSEGGLWWLARPEDAELPLADRLELELLDWLRQRGAATWEEIDQAACATLRGMQTPPPELLRVCLEAVAEPLNGTLERWQLRASEQPAARAAELDSIRARLQGLAAQLGLAASPGNPQIWAGPRGEKLYALFLLENGVFSPLLFEDTPLPHSQCVLIYPPGRSAWITARLLRDPRLAGAINTGWRFLKYEAVAAPQCLEIDTLARWEALLNREPPAREATQIAMF